MSLNVVIKFELNQNLMEKYCVFIYFTNEFLGFIFYRRGSIRVSFLLFLLFLSFYGDYWKYSSNIWADHMRINKSNKSKIINNEIASY